MLLEAVIGVVGVFASIRVGGGVNFPLSELCSCKAAIFAAVGVLKGPKFIGGKLRGCKFFLERFITSFCSISDEVLASDFRGPGFRRFVFGCILTGGSRNGGFESVPVELLWMLLVSGP